MPAMTPGQGSLSDQRDEDQRMGRPGSGRMDGRGAGTGQRFPSSGTTCAEELGFVHPFIPQMSVKQLLGK